MTRRLHIDCETRSLADLPKVGAARYAEDESTAVLLVAYALDDGPVALWDCTADLDMPDDLRGYLDDPDVVRVAHNANFEMLIFDNCLGIPFDPTRWQCTQVLALMASFPAALSQLSEVLRLDDKGKHFTGGKLIRRFSLPHKRKDTGELFFYSPADAPDEWAQFGEYCRADVVAEREVERLLSPLMPSAREWSAWWQDQAINRAGLPIDRRLVGGALALDATHRARLFARAVELTGLDNPNSRDQLLAWLNDNGAGVEDATKATVAELQKTAEGKMADVLAIRAELSMTSVKKFEALSRATCFDGRLRGAFQFAGAGRTSRWAGRIFQPQNLPRGDGEVLAQLGVARDVVASGDYDLAAGLYPSVSGLLSTTIRTAIAAPPGRQLIVADFASIETVMVAWAAGCENLLDVFREGRDAYKDFATAMFGVGYDDVTKKMRQTAKPAVLGCCYYLGGPGLAKYAAGYGVEMTEAKAKATVNAYREKYSDIVDFWYRLAAAARLVVVDKSPVEHVGRFRFAPLNLPGVGNFLTIRLPSGRSLCYFAPEFLVEPGRDSASLTYMGLDQTTRKWQRQTTHPGKITENLVQAVARDLLVDALRRAGADPRLEIVGHVHDEIIALADVRDDTALDRLLDYMRAVPEWAEGAPLNAAGYASAFYKKD